MDKNRKENSRSTLYSYYTLAHAMTPRHNSPTHARTPKRSDIESGDETDRSVDNEVIESFFMDEINENTESCSLNSSRENLLDGEPVKDVKPNSRPGSARRASYRNTELPIDERIKVLEEGLKEADMEREVVLSCLGKEYLERVTMQNCLQEICTKSGYSYDTVVSNFETQSGAKNILQSIIETRTKALLGSKERPSETTEKPHKANENNDIGEKESDSITPVQNSRHPELDFDTAKEERLKEVLMKFTQAEQGKINRELNRKNDRHESSHTDGTKSPEKGKQTSIAKTTANENSPAEEDKVANSMSDNNRIVPDDQSKSRLDDSLKSSKTTGYNVENISQKGYNPERAIERSSLIKEKGVDSKGFEIASKHTDLTMPEKSEGPTQNSSNSILRSLELRRQEKSEGNLDSIDEGIFMIKTFLTGLKGDDEISSQFNGVEQPVASWSRGPQSSDVSKTSSPERTRKFSLNETRRIEPESLALPQRRRSFAEGVDMDKSKQAEYKSSVVSRLFKPTVSSRNKAKDKVGRKEAESDTEGGRARSGRSKKSNGLRRSTSDVRHGPRRQFYSYTSAEEDSSIDGDAMEQRELEEEAKPFDVSTEMRNREYGKIMTILSMLQDQKRNWESESKSLREKLDGESKLRSDLAHDNNVLRKSLEAANHAIKEINSKVQELKMTIVPLREENTKLRDQNQSVKAKLDLLRKEKTGMVQEIQELRQSKRRFEDALLALGDLYRNGRLSLVSDQNNNTSDDSEWPVVDLKFLLEIKNENEDQNKPALSSKRLNRGRDYSKRHSFHGFEKIDELGGNAEELLAEKEKVEKENETLKRELNEMREKIKEEREAGSENDTDLGNRRKGWRMQREESKHRIIREILKTESNQVYGRPYASCTDLTLDDKDEKAKREFLKSMQKDGSSRPNNDDNGGKNGDKEKTTDSQENSGGLSFTVRNEKKRKPRAEISWKEESEKIDKLLASWKLERSKQKDDDEVDSGLVERERVATEQPTQARVNKDTKKALHFEDKEGSSTEWMQSIKETFTKMEADYATMQNSTFSFSTPVQERYDLNSREGANNMDANGVFQHDVKSSKRNGNGGQTEGLSHSPQWPLVREKIKEIYKQPVEILEQSFVWKEPERRDANQKQKMFVAEENPYELRREMQHKEDTKYSSSRYNQGFMNMAAKFNGDIEDGRGKPRTEEKSKGSYESWSEDDDRKGDYNWQRKSSSEEILSYEDYRRKLRQREMEKAYSNGLMDSNDGRGLGINNSDGYVRKQEFDRRLEGRTETSSHQTTQQQRNSNTTTTEYQGKASKSMTVVNGVRESGDDASWVNVPVYVKIPKKEASDARNTTPKGSFKHLETHEASKTRDGSRKLIEETITKVESAFNTTKPATQRTQSKRSSDKTKSSKASKDFVRRSPGTVMYLDELAEYDSDSSYDVPVPRRTRSFRKPRPKSDVFPSRHTEEEFFEERESSKNSAFKRNRSLRLPRRPKDDIFSVDISIEGESQDDLALAMHSGSFHSTPAQHSSFQLALVQSDASYYNSSYSGGEEQKCQHHQLQPSSGDGFIRARFQSESGTSTTRSSGRRPKSPSGFSCEMCKEMSRRKSAQERYCWQKYFPIGETTIETIVIKEDYV